MEIHLVVPRCPTTPLTAIKTEQKAASFYFLAFFLHHYFSNQGLNYSFQFEQCKLDIEVLIMLDFSIQQGAVTKLGAVSPPALLIHHLTAKKQIHILHIPPTRPPQSKVKNILHTHSKGNVSPIDLVNKYGILLEVEIKSEKNLITLDFCQRCSQSSTYRKQHQIEGNEKRKKSWGA